jgi:hypothetical protein
VFDSDSEKCTICPENTHKVGYNKYTTCNACTANSFGAAGRTGPLECSCSANHEANPLLCAPCKPGNYKNESTKIGLSNELFVTSQTMNLARACRAGGCPVTTNADYDSGPNGYPARNVNDGNLNTFHHTTGAPTWTIIDLEQTVFVTRIRIYNRFAPDCCANKLKNFNLRLGNSPTFLNNPACALDQANFENFRDFTCILSGRYFSIDMPLTYLHLREIEIYGTKHEYTYESANEWKTDVVSTVLGRCRLCPQNTATNNTGVLACEACAAGKTTDRRTGQVECVCDIGTEPDADGECVTCREGRYKATTTDKYANRECVACGACGANNQVATECNSTHNITCRACQANSWSYARRTLLDPCFCNAGYELQGQLCVACPAGKARQVNNSNSIVCETCASGTLTTVTATTVCRSCTANCETLVGNKNRIADFTGTYSQTDYQYNGFGGSSRVSWLAYADSIGATYSAINAEGYGGVFGHSVIAYIDFTLPSGYSFVEIDAPAFHQSGMQLYIGGVHYGYCDSQCKVIAPYKPGDKVRLLEDWSVIPYAIKISVFNIFNNVYVLQECNASRDVICQVCQTCGPGFYANNTCGINYGNDRLDTQCVSCPENAFCPGTTTFQKPLLCSEQRCGANQQVATLCNGTHNVTCRACQANSWTTAGRTKLGPCLCNAGYELQGELCVACPVGKARQANYNNSIVCEVCAAATFTSVSTSITCGACSQDCPDPTFPAINLARTCSAGGCPVTSSLSVASPAYDGFMAVDGITALMPPNIGFISRITDTPWLMIDLEKTVYVWMVRLYNRPDCCQERLTNFEIRVGSSSTFANNPACASNQPSFNPSKDFPCVLSGRYLSVQLMYTSGTSSLGVGEVEVYGYTRQDHLPPAVMERRYVKHECNQVPNLSLLQGLYILNLVSSTVFSEK